MKALVYTNPLEMALQERPYPKLESNEVIVQVAAAGICGSDMHAFHGHDPRRKPGLVLGHELAGTVIESASPGFEAGQLVTANPLITCGHCAYCREGRDNLCANRTMIGMTRPGAFAEFLAIPAASLIPIPTGMSLIHAAVTEPAATALHAINLSMRSLARPLPEIRSLIIGGGAIGLLTALLLRSYGCRRIRLAEVNPRRRQSAEIYAGCSTYSPLEQNTEESAFDLVIDAVGAVVTRNSALTAVKPGGVIMHIGLQDWASEIDMRKLTLAEVTLLGTYTYTMADMYAAVHALHEGAFGTLDWVETRPLDKGAQAFADLNEQRTASSKLVLVPTV
jgi:2-desacetyl-2-hydroxyethyl bacteriochlorophyllide A dehydrogenase